MARLFAHLWSESLPQGFLAVPADWPQLASPNSPELASPNRCFTYLNRFLAQSSSAGLEAAAGARGGGAGALRPGEVPNGDGDVSAQAEKKNKH